MFGEVDFHVCDACGHHYMEAGVTCDCSAAAVQPPLRHVRMVPASQLATVARLAPLVLEYIAARDAHADAIRPRSQWAQVKRLRPDDPILVRWRDAAEAMRLAALDADQSGGAARYRMLAPGDVLEADDEFLTGNGVTWVRIGGMGFASNLVLGAPYQPQMAPARRKVAG